MNRPCPDRITIQPFVALGLRYQPYLLDGKPAKIETNITVNFEGE